MLNKRRINLGKLKIFIAFNRGRNARIKGGRHTPSWSLHILLGWNDRKVHNVGAGYKGGCTVFVDRYSHSVGHANYHALKPWQVGITRNAHKVPTPNF